MKKALIVDDSATVRLQLAGALSHAGFDVLEASDGLEGLERVAQHDDLSIIVLDVNMPRLNGLDMLDKLKGEAKTASIPVLILTTEAQHSMVARAKQAGAKAWLIKPIKMDSFVDVVRKLMS